MLPRKKGLLNTNVKADDHEHPFPTSHLPNIPISLSH